MNLISDIFSDPEEWLRQSKNTFCYLFKLLFVIPITYLGAVMFASFVFTWAISGFGFLLVIGAITDGDFALAYAIIGIDVILFVIWIRPKIIEFKKNK